MISESLTPFVHPVILARPEDTVAAAARKLRDARVGCVVVTRGDHVVGILTDRDIALRAVASGLDPERTIVQEIMTSDPLVLESSDTVRSAAELMQKHGVRRVPIVDERHVVLGIVTADDIVAQFGSQIAAVGAAISEASDSDDSR